MWTLSEVAQYLQVHPATVVRWIRGRKKKGAVPDPPPHKYVGEGRKLRFPKQAVIDWASR